jgi:hypothetical protein
MELSDEDWEFLEYMADLMDHIDRRVREFKSVFENHVAS